MPERELPTAFRVRNGSNIKIFVRAPDRFLSKMYLCAKGFRYTHWEWWTKEVKKK